jgi:hypothetical protein
MNKVRTANQREVDRRLKERAWGYLENSLTVYPDNYETLIYMSNKVESQSEKAELYARSKSALQKYEAVSKKGNVNRVNQLLKMLDPYYNR